MPILEDLEMSRALRRLGRLARIPLRVETSGTAECRRRDVREYLAAEYCCVILYLQTAARRRRRRQQAHVGKRSTGMKRQVIAFAKSRQLGTPRRCLGERLWLRGSCRAATPACCTIPCSSCSGLPQQGITVELRLRFAGIHPPTSAAFPDFRLLPEQGEDLGERLQDAVQAAFAQGQRPCSPSGRTRLSCRAGPSWTPSLHWKARILCSVRAAMGAIP